MGKLISELAVVINRTEEEAINLILAQSHNYKIAYIPKKNGGERKIYLPSPELKVMQHFIVEKYLSKIKISPYAIAYSKGKNIYANAEPHLGNTHFLFIDLHNFFDSIDYHLLKHVLYKELGNQCNERDVETILRVCSMDGVFIQGCVSSPVISNIFMKDFDARVANIVSNIPNGKYTRYSDDITISSSEKIPDSLLNNIIQLLEDKKLRINQSKTHFSSNIENVRITGLKANKRISVDHDTKRKLNSMLYMIARYKGNSDLNPEVVLGYLNYIKAVDMPFYKKIIRKYNSKEINILKLLNELIKDKVK